MPCSRIRLRRANDSQGDARGQSVHHHMEALVVIDVELLWRADLLVRHDAVRLTQTVG